jgi:hypothetical protein
LWLSRSNYTLDSKPLSLPGYSLADRQYGERSVRLDLVPVGDRGEIVAPLVVVAVLDGYPDGPFERHRILDVEPVEADVPAPVAASAKGDAVIGGGIFLLGLQAVLK